MAEGESGSRSKQQIAQQFVLPERQAKVNLLIKAMEQAAEDEEPQHYCICRSTDSDRFMIEESDFEAAPAPVKKRRSSSESSPTKKEKKKVKSKGKLKGSAPKTKKSKQKSSGAHWRTQQENEEVGEVEDDSPRQCFGPGCTQQARTGSKYCSDDCGMKLAKRRIYEILPSQIQRWQGSPCVGEENNKKALEKLRREQMEVRITITELDRKHQELDALLERCKKVPINPDLDGAEGDDEAELSIYCVTCGQEINQRGAIKHMEKCFTKFEAQTSFGSIYKTRIEGNSMFCDYFNPQQKTYCKRLKVLCPEHTKERKIGPDEVCGSPLVTNVFEEKNEFCRVSKRKCAKHFCWEKLRRAEIDLERLRQWMKLDELFEQERNIRMAMSNRMGVLGLMLHQTVDHDPMTPMIPMKS
nr:hypothetical protein BaRGS_024222 [Batillaria attramentaria]